VLRLGPIMSLFDVIAAGHRGQCFALLARRFLVNEPQAALAVRFLLPAVLPSFEAWVSEPAGLTSFLDAMSRGGYDGALTLPATLSNSFERDRGVQLLELFRSVREIDGADIARAAEASGLTYRVLLQMLPFVALFMMAALRINSQTPLREILIKRLGSRLKTSADPFADLAELVAWEAKGPRHGILASVLDGLFNRQGADRPELTEHATASLA